MRADRGDSRRVETFSRPHQTYIFVRDVVQQSPTGAKPGPNWPDPAAGGGWGGFPGMGGGGQVIDYGMDPDVVNDARYKDLIDDMLLAIPSIRW